MGKVGSNERCDSERAHTLGPIDENTFDIRNRDRVGSQTEEVP